MDRRSRPRARRAALPALATAALALAGCRVDVEGAPCTVPGDVADCPSGQACGNDLRCSARAAECGPCTPGALRCAGSRRERCIAGDPVCGAWTLDQDCGGLVCSGQAAFACVCPANGRADFAADPLGSDAGAAPHPTGVEAPRECRFRKLGDALAAAAAAGGPATVRVLGDPGPVVFGKTATGEAFPLLVASNVALHGAAAPAGPTVIRAESDVGDLVTLAGSMEGLRIETTAATGTGVATSCDGATPTMAGVVVDGSQKLTKGISVESACGAALSGVDVSRIDGPALRISVGASVPVSVAGSTFRTSGTGIWASGGTIAIGPDPDSLTPSQAVDNSGNGIRLDGSTAVEATVDGVVVSGNGGTGVVVDSVPAASKLTITSCEVHSNGTTAARTYGGASPRTCGGVLVSQLSLAAFTFLGNRVYANTGDELAFESSGQWSIAPASCGPASNAFGCTGGNYAVAIVGTGGAVDASRTVWPGTPPTSFASPGVATALYCGAGSEIPSVPACP